MRFGCVLVATGAHLANAGTERRRFGFYMGIMATYTGEFALALPIASALRKSISMMINLKPVFPIHALLDDVHLHTRALFFYSMAALLLGAQFMSIGFLAELMTAYQRRDADSYSIAQWTGQDLSSSTAETRSAGEDDTPRQPTDAGDEQRRSSQEKGRLSQQSTTGEP